MKTFTSLLAGVATLVQAESLPVLKGDPDTITVSGWNTGATLACMLQVIMSDTIQGAYCHKGAAFGVHSSQVRKAGTEQEITESVVA